MDFKRRRIHGYDCLFIGCLGLNLVLHVLAETTTAATATTTETPWYDQEYPKAVVTVGVLAAACIIGVIVAKIADKCYERLSIRDDASDMSEGTKVLLRQQLAMMSFNKFKIGAKPKTAKEKKEVAEMRGRVAFQKWRANVITRREIREREAKERGEVIPIRKKSGVSITNVTTSESSTDKSSPKKSVPTPIPKSSPKKETDKHEDDEFQFIDETIAALDNKNKKDKSAAGAGTGAAASASSPTKSQPAPNNTPRTDNAGNKLPYSRHINKREDSTVSRPPTAAANRQNRPNTAAGGRPTTARSGSRPTTVSAGNRPTTAKKVRVAPVGLGAKR